MAAHPSQTMWFILTPLVNFNGGEKVKELEVCLAAVETHTNGENNGSNGGRVCWAIT
ncbi:MAG: hypothetical protein V1862_06965 [Methanobacteriota archaeon]